MAEVEDKVVAATQTGPKRRGRKPAKAVETDTKVGVDPAISVKPGDYVYLTFLAGQDIRIAGTVVNWANREIQLEEDISAGELLRVDRFVRMGELTVGRLPKLTKKNDSESVSYLERDPDVLEYCVDIVDRGPVDTRELCSGLARAGTHLSGWAPKDLISGLIKHESKGLSRPNVMAILHTALSACRLISFRSVPFDPKKHATSEVIQKIDKIRTRG